MPSVRTVGTQDRICWFKKEAPGEGASWVEARLGFFLVVLFVGFGSFVFGDFLDFGVGGWGGRSGWLSWLGWLSVSYRSGDSVTFGSESGVALDEDDDTFDEAPDAATHDSDVREEHEEAEEEAHEWDFGGEGDHDGGKHDKNEATTGQSDVDEAFLFLAEVPVVGAESTEEDTEETSGDGGFDAGRDGVLEGRVVQRVGAGSVSVWGGIWIGVWVHKISLVI